MVVFAGHIRDPVAAARLDELARYLDSADGAVRRTTPDDTDDDAVIECLLVPSGERAQIEQDQIPEFFMPVNGKWRPRGIFH
jgi:phenol 2-monooxygenase (NADPH)